MTTAIATWQQCFFFLLLFFLLSLSLVVTYRTNWRTIWSQPQIYSLKKFLTLYFLEKIFLMFWKMELSSRMIRKFIILCGLSHQNFFLKRFFFYFFLKQPDLKNYILSKNAFLIFRKQNFLTFSQQNVFLIFWERYIQNHEIFRITWISFLY